MFKKPESPLLMACQNCSYVAALIVSLSLWLTLLTVPPLLAEEAGGDAAEAGNTPAAGANSEPPSDKQLDERQPKDEQVQDDAHHRTNATCLDEDYGPLIDLRREFGRIRRGEVEGLSVPDYRIDGWEETRRATIAAFNRGHYKQATRLAKSLREDARGMLGKSHLGYAISVEIGATISDIVDGTVSEARDFLEATIIYKAHYGKGHPVYAACLTKHGLNLAQQGHIDGAINMIEQAEALQRNVFRGPHVRIAEALAAKAYAYSMAHRTREGLQVAQESNKLFEKAGAGNSVACAVNLGMLAHLQCQRSEYDRALAALRGADEIFEAKCHPNDPRRATNKVTKAKVYRYQGEYQKAYDLEKELTTEYARRYGLLSSQHLDTLNNIAGSAEKLGDIDEAERLYLKALELSEAKSGSTNIRSLIICHNLGKAYRGSGELDKAEQFLTEASNAIAQLGLHKHVLHGSCQVALGDVLVQKGDKVNGETQIVAGRIAIENAVGKSNMFYIDATRILANCHIGEGRVAEGLRLLDEAIQAAESCVGKEHEEVQRLRTRRAEVVAAE